MNHSHTVVGSSKNTKEGLAMNASAALTFRLFPPLPYLSIQDTAIIMIVFTLDSVRPGLHMNPDQRF